MRWNQSKYSYHFKRTWGSYNSHCDHHRKWTSNSIPDYLPMYSVKCKWKYRKYVGWVYLGALLVSVCVCLYNIDIDWTRMMLHTWFTWILSNSTIHCLAMTSTSECESLFLRFFFSFKTMHIFRRLCSLVKLSLNRSLTPCFFHSSSVPTPRLQIAVTLISFII